MTKEINNIYIFNVTEILAGLSPDVLGFDPERIDVKQTITLPVESLILDKSGYLNLNLGQVIDALPKSALPIFEAEPRREQRIMILPEQSLTKKDKFRDTGTNSVIFVMIAIVAFLWGNNRNNDESVTEGKNIERERIRRAIEELPNDTPLDKKQLYEKFNIPAPRTGMGLEK